MENENYALTRVEVDPAGWAMPPHLVFLPQNPGVQPNQEVPTVCGKRGVLINIWGGLLCWLVGEEICPDCETALGA